MHLPPTWTSSGRSGLGDSAGGGASRLHRLLAPVTSPSAANGRNKSWLIVPKVRARPKGVAGTDDVMSFCAARVEVRPRRASHHLRCRKYARDDAASSLQEAVRPVRGLTEEPEEWCSWATVPPQHQMNNLVGLTHAPEGTAPYR